MKKFLLTWYGIADLRASLGFENTSGPIAGALAAEPYSDVVILGYTRADDDSAACAQAQRGFATEWGAIRSVGQEKDREATDAFISKFANTSAAHAHFTAWLKEKTGKTGARIRFQSEKLRELNDTEGIYACAMRALDLVAQEPDDKQITLYLSPGTPVMAFVWAFAALSHPDLKKRLIASPVVGKAPEVIPLPAEWLERHGAKQEMLHSAVDEDGGFDVTYHLFGEQRMPSLLGIRQFDSKRHVFLSSLEYPAACMKPFIQESGFGELTVDPWNARDTRETIVRDARRLPPKARIGINLTGGTKLMFVGALSAARALGAVPFYFDSRNCSVTFIDSLRHESIKPIDSVEPFLRVNSDELNLADKSEMEGMSPDNQRLTKTLWEQRHKMGKCYRKLIEYCDTFRPFHVQEAGFVFKLNKNETATVQGYGLDMVFDNWPDFAKFLCGGWLEEYVYLLCKPYEDAGVIHDLRINVKLNLSTAGQQSLNAAYNEIDIAFTDGYSLYIVECKAGKVKQEQVMKLQNLVRIYGGVEGRGIVASCFPPDAESVKKKIKDARLTLWQGSETWPIPISKQVKSLMDEIAARAKSTGAAV
jgi:hypothetical protein